MLLATARSDRAKSSTLRLMSASIPDARLSRVWRASSSPPWGLSIMPLVQRAEKPITVATDDTISSLADSRQGRLALSLCRPNPIARAPYPDQCARNGCWPLKSQRPCVNELTLHCRDLAKTGQRDDGF